MSQMQTFERAKIIPFMPRAVASATRADAVISAQPVLALLRRWTARIAFRRDLTRLVASGPHLLRDIGLEEAEARREAALPFWQQGRL